MSVSGVSGNASQLYDSQWFQQLQQLRSQFQQLGQDLQTGNLTQAQTDFSALSQTVSSSQSSTNGSLNQDFANLGQALQGGSLQDAQKAFATLSQDMQQASAQRPHHHHHHHRAGGSQDTGSTGSQQNNPLAQGFDTLSQALQSGDLSGAQQAYSTLLQNLQQFGLNFGAVSNTNATPGANLTVTA